MIKAATLFLFFLILFSLFWVAQVFLYRRYCRWLESIQVNRLRLWKRVGLFSLLGGNALFFSKYLTSYLGVYDHGLVQIATVYPGAVFFLSVLFAVFFVLLIDGGRAVRWIRRRYGSRVERSQLPNVAPDGKHELVEPKVLDRRQFLRMGGLAVIGVSVGIPSVGALSTSRNYQIKRVPLFFSNLPSGLEGFTIAQVSDFHSGIFMDERQMREIFEVVNSLHPGLVAVTGDFVDRSDAEIPPVARAIRELRAEYGVYGCLGNHDHFATGEMVSAAMEESGVFMLDNENRTLTIDGDRLSIVGLNDVGGRYLNFARMDDAVSGLDPESFKIMLVHQPRMFPECIEAGMDLTLSGHTHGGQVGIEVMGVEVNPVYLVHRYAKGLYEEGGKKLYVNAGIGVVGAPIRLVRPEITLFSLRTA